MLQFRVGSNVSFDRGDVRLEVNIVYCSGSRHSDACILISFESSFVVDLNMVWIA